MKANPEMSMVIFPLQTDGKGKVGDDDGDPPSKLMAKAMLKMLMVTLPLQIDG